MNKRPEIENQIIIISNIKDIKKEFSLSEKLYQNIWLRKSMIISFLLILWQTYAIYLDNPLILPTFIDTTKALWVNIINGNLSSKVFYSLKLLSIGYFIGFVLACLLSITASLTLFGEDLIETLTAAFSPLPAIAILPLAMLWFGLGSVSITLVLVHSVLWPVSLSIHTGFKSISQTLRMVGHNYGLCGIGFVIYILFPASLVHILTGMKIGWAFAWRSLIAAELVFGVSSGSGGIGWFIAENKNNLAIAETFAGLFSIIAIGFIFEHFLFRLIEQRTVNKWGMQSQLA